MLVALSEYLNFNRSSGIRRQKSMTILPQKDILKESIIIIFTFEPDGIFFHLDQVVRHKNMECQALPFEPDWHDRGLHRIEFAWRNQRP